VHPGLGYGRRRRVHRVGCIRRQGVEHARGAQRIRYRAHDCRARGCRAPRVYACIAAGCLIHVSGNAAHAVGCATCPAGTCAVLFAFTMLQKAAALPHLCPCNLEPAASSRSQTPQPPSAHLMQPHNETCGCMSSRCAPACVSEKEMRSVALLKSAAPPRSSNATMLAPENSPGCAARQASTAAATSSTTAAGSVRSTMTCTRVRFRAVTKE